MEELFSLPTFPVVTLRAAGCSEAGAAARPPPTRTRADRDGPGGSGRDPGQPRAGPGLTLRLGRGSAPRAGRAGWRTRPRRAGRGGPGSPERRSRRRLPGHRDRSRRSGRAATGTRRSPARSSYLRRQRKQASPALSEMLAFKAWEASPKSSGVIHDSRYNNFFVSLTTGAE